MKCKSQYLGQIGNDKKVAHWINVNLENYLKKNPEDQGEIEHILDFLTSNKAPSRIKYMSYPEAKAGAEKWVKAMRKKAEHIVETEEDTETFVYYKKSGARWAILKGNAAFQREGNLMSHCVASYYGKSDLVIYSLRDKDNNPHCTIEINKNSDNSVNQIKGKGNGAIHPKYIKYVLDFLKKMKFDVRDSEMKNLGYMNITEEIHAKAWNLIYDNFEESSVKFITVNGKKYLYMHNEMDRK